MARDRRDLKGETSPLITQIGQVCTDGAFLSVLSA